MLRARVPRIALVSGGGGVTGTGAVTIAGPTLAAAGACTAPAVTGAGDITIAGPSLSVSGAATAPAHTASGAITIGGPLIAGAGTSTGDGVAGSGGISIAGPAVSGSGAATVPAHTASGGVTIGRPTVAATGSVTSGGGGTIDPAVLWGYELLPGITAGQMLIELWRLHGLDAANPLTVTDSARNVETIAQTITNASGTVTVSRA